MKIKDLPKGTNLGGLKVKTPKGVVGYWKSQWGYDDGKAGVWLSDGKSGRIYPQFLNNLKETLEWECNVEDEVNCNALTGLEHIDYTNDDFN